MRAVLTVCHCPCNVSEPPRTFSHPSCPHHCAFLSGFSTCSDRLRKGARRQRASEQTLGCRRPPAVVVDTAVVQHRRSGRSRPDRRKVEHRRVSLRSSDVAEQRRRERRASSELRFCAADPLSAASKTSWALSAAVAASTTVRWSAGPKEAFADATGGRRVDTKRWPLPGPGRLASRPSPPWLGFSVDGGRRADPRVGRAARDSGGCAVDGRLGLGCGGVCRRRRPEGRPSGQVLLTT